MKHVIRIIGSVLGNATPDDGCYLTLYDPHAGDHGYIETSSDFARARVFEDAGAAMECWRQVNRNQPTRPDGKPNRPLTAYTVELVKLA
jgi:hypothetical protein